MVQERVHEQRELEKILLSLPLREVPMKIQGVRDMQLGREMLLFMTA